METESRKGRYVRIFMDILLAVGFIAYFLYDDFMFPVMYKPLLNFIISICLFFTAVLCIYQFMMQREKSLVVSAAGFLIAFVIMLYVH
jgi:hypothetical protein